MLKIMSHRAQRGSGLFESMISIFVVSIGFLGFAGLQVNALATANDSLFRSKAVYLAYQMADRVRANLPAVPLGSYDSMTGTASNPGCIATNCSAAQVAQNDFYEWTTEIGSMLPSGAGAICLDSTPDDGAPGDAQCDGAGSVYSIKIWWSEKGTQSTDSALPRGTHRLVTVLRP
jgi:type IV pilus assembly protein PilV